MATATYICSSELKFFIQLQKSFSASFARSARAVPMDFFGMKSTWADDGVAEEQDESEYAEGGAEMQAPPIDPGADALDVDGFPQEAAAEEENLLCDEWVDDLPPTAAPILGEASVAREALELLQLLAAPPPAAPSARAPVGRPAGPDRNPLHPRRSRGGMGGGLRGGGSHVG